MAYANYQGPYNGTQNKKKVSLDASAGTHTLTNGKTGLMDGAIVWYDNSTAESVKGGANGASGAGGSLLAGVVQGDTENGAAGWVVTLGPTIAMVRSSSVTVGTLLYVDRQSLGLQKLADVAASGEAKLVARALEATGTVTNSTDATTQTRIMVELLPTFASTIPDTAG